jgi:hypothetical protein
MIGLTVQSGTMASITQARKALGNKVVLEASLMGYESKEDGQQSTVISKKNELTVREASKLISSDLIEAYDYVLYGFAGADIKAVSPDENTSSIGTVSTGGDQPEISPGGQH